MGLIFIDFHYSIKTGLIFMVLFLEANKSVNVHCQSGTKKTRHDTW